MNKYKYLILIFLMSTNVAAQEVIGVANMYEVDFVRVDRSGKGYVNFKNDLVGTPATCTQATYRAALAFDTNSDGGKSILSIALTAKASGKAIYAKGTGSCSVYGVMEDWNWGYVK